MAVLLGAPQHRWGPARQRLGRGAALAAPRQLQQLHRGVAAAAGGGAAVEGGAGDPGAQVLTQRW